jgi:hypothetical protein
MVKEMKKDGCRDVVRNIASDPQLSTGMHTRRRKVKLEKILMHNPHPRSLECREESLYCPRIDLNGYQLPDPSFKIARKCTFTRPDFNNDVPGLRVDGIDNPSCDIGVPEKVLTE